MHYIYLVYLVSPGILPTFLWQLGCGLLSLSDSARIVKVKGRYKSSWVEDGSWSFDNVNARRNVNTLIYGCVCT